MARGVPARQPARRQPPQLKTGGGMAHFCKHTGGMEHHAPSLRRSSSRCPLYGAERNTLYVKLLRPPFCAVCAPGCTTAQSVPSPPLPERATSTDLNW